jgi:hypothetical protein
LHLVDASTYGLAHRPDTLLATWTSLVTCQIITSLPVSLTLRSPWCREELVARLQMLTKAKEELMDANY